MDNQAIPASVLELLRHRWREVDPNYSAFDAIFNDEGIRQPSYYIIRAGRKLETDFDVFSHVEAMRLIKDGVFGSVVSVADDKTVGINEHVAHAMQDFCQEVYTSWAKYQRRLAEVEAVCPAPEGAS